MDTADIEVLSAAIDWRQNGYPVFMATVVHTWGSAPRPVGSLLAIRSDGVMKGSVSGGCIEDDLGERARQHKLASIRPELVTYGVTAEEAHRFGLPCGGTLQLVIEPVSAASKLTELLAGTLNGETILRTLDVSTGIATLSALAAPQNVSFDGRHLSVVHGPKMRTILVGAGQLSEYVARLAIPLGYHVIVCDPRIEYLDNWSIPQIELSREMPDDLLMRIGIDCNTAVLTLTHDPKLDDMALLEALKSDAFYIGAIGSRANTAKRRERLKLFDLTIQQIDRLRAPIGLYLGAQTPPEIAISIVAEMIAMQRNVPVLQGHALREPHCAGYRSLRFGTGDQIPARSENIEDTMPM